jgi:abequosyltransferase
MKPFVFQPILSICIPTYNRSSYLTDCILSIISSAGNNLPNIEIIISDNASQDNTRQKVIELQKVYKIIKYHRNEINYGERNFFIVAGFATGDYIWIFGDDDQMERNAIGKVLNIISAGHNLIVLNHSIWLDRFSREFRRKALPFAEDMIFQNHNKVMSVLGPRLGFISSVVIKRDIFLNVPSSEYEAFYDKGFPFLTAVYLAIYGNCRAYFVAEPLIRQTGNMESMPVNTWYGMFAKGSSLAIEKLHQKGYSSKAAYSAKKLVLKDYILHDISRRKRMGEDRAGIISFTFPHYKNQFFYWLVIIPTLFMPRFLVSFAHKIAVGLLRCGYNRVK